MESLGPLMRKFDFPQSVCEALKIIHIQCEKMSLNPSSALSQELSQITDFVDEFVFGNHQSKAKKLNYLEQLQVIQALIDHFDSDEGEFSLLCSVFMVVFLAKGKDVEFKMDTLSKLISLNLSQGHNTMLNCVALWWSQQPPNSKHCNQLARSLVHEYMILVPDIATLLKSTPQQSPLLAGILLIHFGDLYKVSSENTNPVFKAPPLPLVKLSTTWLMEQKDLCGAQGKSECQNVVSMLGKSPIPALIVWSVLAPLVTQEVNDLDYSRLHLSLLLHITQANVDASFPVGFLSTLTEILLSMFDAGKHSEVVIGKSLDRYGQALQAGLGAGVHVDQDLLLLISQLPYNRLIQIVTSSIR